MIFNTKLNDCINPSFTRLAPAFRTRAARKGPDQPRTGVKMREIDGHQGHVHPATTWPFRSDPTPATSSAPSIWPWSFWPCPWRFPSSRRPGFWSGSTAGRVGFLRPCPHWPRRSPFHLLENPHTMHRDASARLAALLLSDPAVGQAWNSHGKLPVRPPHHPGRAHPAAPQHRRTAPGLERALRRHVPSSAPAPSPCRNSTAMAPAAATIWPAGRAFPASGGSGRNRLTYDDRVHSTRPMPNGSRWRRTSSVILRTVPTVLGLTGL